jgi:hypothetical protein
MILTEGAEAVAKGEHTAILQKSYIDRYPASTMGWMVSICQRILASEEEMRNLTVARLRDLLLLCMSTRDLKSTGAVLFLAGCCNFTMADICQNQDLADHVLWSTITPAVPSAVTTDTTASTTAPPNPRAPSDGMLSSTVVDMTPLNVAKHVADLPTCLSFMFHPAYESHMLQIKTQDEFGWKIFQNDVYCENYGISRESMMEELASGVMPWGNFTEADITKYLAEYMKLKKIVVASPSKIDHVGRVQAAVGNFELSMMSTAIMLAKVTSRDGAEIFCHGIVGSPLGQMPNPDMVVMLESFNQHNSSYGDESISLNSVPTNGRMNNGMNEGSIDAWSNWAGTFHS